MASEGRERVAWIVARVLPFLGPPIGIERVPYRTAYAPRGKGCGLSTERQDRRIVQREDGVKADPEQLFHVAEVADDLRGGPVRGVGPPSKLRGASVADRLGELVSGAGQAREPPLERLPGNLRAWASRPLRAGTPGR